MNNQETRTLYAKMREFAKNVEVPMITAKQHPPLPGTRNPPPVSDVILIDYLDIIRK